MSVGAIAKNTWAAVHPRCQFHNVATFVDRAAALVGFRRLQFNRLFAYGASWFRTAGPHLSESRERYAVQIMNCQGSASMRRNPLLSDERNCWGLGLLTYRIHLRPSPANAKMRQYPGTPSSWEQKYSL
jgi:hypothetical protein